MLLTSDNNVFRRCLFFIIESRYKHTRSFFIDRFIEGVVCFVFVCLHSYRSRIYVLYIYGRVYFRDRLCGLVVRVLGYRSEGPGSIPSTTRKKKVVGLERGPFSLVSTTEELLDIKVAAPV
jgi:hypothetical protein